MADNLAVTPGSGAIAAADEATYSGDTSKVQVIRQVHVTGSEGSKSVVELVRLEDAAHTSGDPGIPSLGVRKDIAASLAGTDGDYTFPIFDALNRLHVNVHQDGDVVSITPTLDTSAYTAGDVLFATTSFTGAVRMNDGRSLLQSLVVIDKDDQKPAFDLHFFSSNVTSGAFNGAPSISDSDAGNYLGSVSIAASDYKDLGGVSVATIKNIGLLLEAASGATNVYAFAVVSTTPTHTASGLVFRLGYLFL